MATLYVRHPVADYALWRKAFDENEPARRAFGLTVLRVQRSAYNPLEIIITLAAEDLARARAFIESDDLRLAMTRAGVQGRPEIWFAEEIAA